MLLRQTPELISGSFCDSTKVDLVLPIGFLSELNTLCLPVFTSLKQLGKINYRLFLSLVSIFPAYVNLSKSKKQGNLA